MGRVPGPLGAPAVGVAPVVEVVAEITRRRGGVTCSGQRLLRVWSQRGRCSGAGASGKSSGSQQARHAIPDDRWCHDENLLDRVGKLAPGRRRACIDHLLLTRWATFMAYGVRLGYDDVHDCEICLFAGPCRHGQRPSALTVSWTPRVPASCKCLGPLTGAGSAPCLALPDGISPRTSPLIRRPGTSAASYAPGHLRSSKFSPLSASYSRERSTADCHTIPRLPPSEE
jgi:hypothetical protein